MSVADIIFIVYCLYLFGVFALLGWWIIERWRELRGWHRVGLKMAKDYETRMARDR